VVLQQRLDCALTVHYHGKQIARFEQAKAYPLRIGSFVPEPEKLIEADFIPDMLLVELGEG